MYGGRADDNEQNGEAHGRGGLVLLVGDTGQGKSTLGNFLADPDTFRDAKAAFARGSLPGKPQTKARPLKDRPYLKLLDTPSQLAVEDILDEVKKAGHVAGVVVCLKYHRTLDGSAKSLLVRYAEVFGAAVMLSNMVLVLTHFTEDAQADDERDEQGFVLEPILANLRRELKSLLGGECGPIVTIDAFPSGSRSDAVESSLRRRAEIMELIDSMPRTSSAHLNQPRRRQLIGHAGALLLIGATGSGKSTLGNFLVNPSTIRDSATASFVRGNTNTPQTQSCQLATVQEGEFQGQEVIDTPGLLEPNRDDDQRHMAALFEAAQRDAGVVGLVLCLKANHRLDQPTVSLLKYYAAVFGGSLRSNLIVALTHHTEDAQADDDRRAMGASLSPVVSALRDKLDALFGGGGDCPIVPIDSFPGRQRDEALRMALWRRRLIFQHASRMKRLSSDSLRRARELSMQVGVNDARGMTEGLVLLLGFENVGKSSLGNLLIDPANIRNPGRVPFVRGGKTQESRLGVVKDTRFPPYTLLDTPGGGELEDVHAEIMAETARAGKLAGVIYCASRSALSRFTARTIQLWVAALGDAVRPAVVVALLSDGPTSSSSTARRPPEAIEKWQQSLEALAVGGRKCPVVPIDPFPDQPAAVAAALRQREEIFAHLGSIKAIPASSLSQVPLTENTQHQDVKPCNLM